MIVNVCQQIRMGASNVAALILQINGRQALKKTRERTRARSFFIIDEGPKDQHVHSVLKALTTQITAPPSIHPAACTDTCSRPPMPAQILLKALPLQFVYVPVS